MHLKVEVFYYYYLVNNVDDLLLHLILFCVQSTIARETLQVFAPLAKLLGMYQIKVSYYPLCCFLYC